MQFKRRGLRKFISDDFAIVAPSGIRPRRETASVEARDRDYDIRAEGDEVWLVDGDRTVGYATGLTTRWHLVVDGRPLTLEQPKFGLHYSTVKADDAVIAECGAEGFRLKHLELRGAEDLADEERVFLLVIALIGWLESDRALVRAADAAGSGGGP